MKLLNDPKYALLICRFLPFFCILTFGLLIVLKYYGTDSDSLDALILIVCVVYGFFMLFYLPSLLFEGNFRFVGSRIGGGTITGPWWYLPFATLTFGLGPLCWYWSKVDILLKIMSAMK